MTGVFGKLHSTVEAESFAVACTWPVCEGAVTWQPWAGRLTATHHTLRLRLLGDPLR